MASDTDRRTTDTKSGYQQAGDAALMFALALALALAVSQYQTRRMDSAPEAGSGLAHPKESASVSHPCVPSPLTRVAPVNADPEGGRASPGRGEGSTLVVGPIALYPIDVGPVHPIAPAGVQTSKGYGQAAPNALTNGQSVLLGIGAARLEALRPLAAGSAFIPGLDGVGFVHLDQADGYKEYFRAHVPSVAPADWNVHSGGVVDAEVTTDFGVGRAVRPVHISREGR